MQISVILVEKVGCCLHIDKSVIKKLFVLISGCILFAWLVLDTSRATAMFTAVWNLFSPFVVGAGIAFVFNVPMRAIERQLADIRRVGLRRSLSIILTILCLVLIVMFVFELLIPQIQMTVASLSQTIPVFVESLAAKLVVLMQDHPELSAWIQDALKLESMDWSGILKEMLGFLSNQVSTVMGGAVSVIGSVTGAIINGVVSMVFAIYCLARKEILARQGRRVLYSLISEHRADEIIRVLRLTNATFSNFISGQCVEACILGCLFAVAMAIFKMPYISLVSVVIAVTALIPVVGAFVGCILGAFFILVNSPVQALTFIIMFLIIQQLENNLIYPRVVGTSIGLPGMWVLVAVTVGGELMGVGGMLLMIPLASVLYALMREFTEKRLAERGIPEEKLQEQPPEIQSKLNRTQRRRERQKLQKMKEKFQQLQNRK